MFPNNCIWTYIYVAGTQRVKDLHKLSSQDVSSEQLVTSETNNGFTGNTDQREVISLKDPTTNNELDAATHLSHIDEVRVRK